MPDAIMRIATGFMASKHLFTASAIGLFEKLAGGPLTLAELAAACGLPARTVGISADAMISLGLLERDGARYRNSAAAAAFLAGALGRDLRPMLRVFDRISYGLWGGLEEAVRAGHGQSQFGRFNDEQQAIYSAGVEAITQGSANALAGAYDLSGHKRVLDVGGGTGSLLIALLRRHPSLQGTLFDLPGACAVARQRLAREPEGARITVVEGSIFTDALPGGHDVITLASTVHVLSEAANLALLRAIRATAAPGARLLLIDLWLDADRGGPPRAAIMSGEFLVMSGEGQSYSEAEADAWLAATGWRKLARRPLVADSSVIIAEPA
jgi:SAM-dependent methyltransferase